MKKFTVKDFITYNNPCFSCDNKINFYIGTEKLPDPGEDPSSVVYSQPSYHRPIVSTEYTELNISISYSNSLKLKIFHKTNKIDSNNLNELIKYLHSHRILLQSKCDRCYTMVESNDLSFNLEKYFIYPVSLKNERLLVTTDENMFHVYSDFAGNQTMINIDKINRTLPVSATKLKLSLLPMYKFKDKIHFLDKMKLYVTFS